jgi:hypothetical protein
MKLLTSPKTVYLLEAGLEVLHEESLEWLNEITFWRDETAFFYSLIVTRIPETLAETKKELEKIEKELISISTDELNELENKVTEHEKLLRYLVDCREEDQSDYRQKHLELSQKIHLLEKRLKTLKKNIFGLIVKMDK